MVHLARIGVLLALAAGLLAQDEMPYPATAGKKGLQVQMIGDAIDLGVRQAALNVDLGRLIPSGAADQRTVGYECGGVGYTFAADYVATLDAQVAPLTAGGAVVTAILLAIRTGDPARDRLFVHAGCSEKAPNGIGAFATDSAAGRAWLDAAVGFLAQRYSGAVLRGRIWNWVVGNEVNSHWWWYHFGEQDLDAVASAYEAAVRIVHGAVRRHSAHGRVFVSLEHHWTARYAAGNARQAVPGRELLTAFAAKARAGGDYDWGVAFHPYPEDLFDCRFWEDKSAVDAADTPRVTFANLPVLLRFLARQAMRAPDGAVRRVILSEQGFHCRDGEDGERDQAAAFALAWSIVQRLDGIDAFILHRHVDHAREGGLNLGLWTRKEGSVCEPFVRRRIADVFVACGTPRFAEVAAFALPVVGLESWNDYPLGGVRAELDGDAVQITADGAPFATVWPDASPRPYVWPLLGPGGVAMTRNFPMGTRDGEEHDHPHHTSLWFAHGDVDGFDFWSGKKHEHMQRVGELQLEQVDDAAVVRCSYQWLAGDEDRQVCTEERQWCFSILGDARVVDFTTVLRAGVSPLVIGDTKEGTFATRVHPALRVDGKVATGTLIDSEGRSGKAVWGKRARWIDCSGTVDGRRVGLAMFDAPQNHGYPTHWHARTYGLLAANPFGVHDFTGAPAGAGRLEIPAGGELRLRYRVLLHGDGWDKARLEAAANAWTGR